MLSVREKLIELVMHFMHIYHKHTDMHVFLVVIQQVFVVLFVVCF